LRATPAHAPQSRTDNRSARGPAQPRRGDLIEKVNQAVNRRLVYRATNNDYDWIAYADGGDCKTYVAVKRQILIRKGIAPGRLAIWEGQADNGVRHAVLVVDGWRMLDNRFTWTVSLHDLRDIGSRGRGYRIRPCAWCEQMARWLSPLPEDRDASLPDFGYAAQLQALRGQAFGVGSAPPTPASR
jgi:hypothetical protein